MTFIEEDAPCVLVRVDMRPSTWQAFAARVGAANVGEALSRIADNAVTPKSTGRKKYTRLTPEERVAVRDLYAAGRSAPSLAREFGVSPSTVWNILGAEVTA